MMKVTSNRLGLLSLYLLLGLVVAARPSSTRMRGLGRTQRHLVQVDVDGFDTNDAFRSAILDLDLATAMELLHLNPNVDYMPSNSQRTLLHILASTGSSEQVLEAMDLLLRNQANVEARTPTGSTPLSVAIRYSGGLKTAQYLLEKWNADVNSRDNEGRTPLYHAIVKQDPDLIRLLLDNGASPYMVRPEDKTGTMKTFTALMRLLASGELPLENRIRLSLAVVNAAKNELELLQQTHPQDYAGNQAKQQNMEFLNQLLRQCRIEDQKIKYDMWDMIRAGDVASMEKFLNSENKVYPYNYDGMELSSMLAYGPKYGDREWNNDQGLVMLALKHGGTTSLPRDGYARMGLFDLTAFAYLFVRPDVPVEDLRSIYEIDAALQDLLRQDSSLLTSALISKLDNDREMYNMDEEFFVPLQFYIDRMRLMHGLGADLNAQVQGRTLIQALSDSTTYMPDSQLESILRELLILGVKVDLDQPLSETLRKLYTEIVSGRRTKAARPATLKA